MNKYNRGNCRNLIIIVSPSDTGYQGRCNQPYENTECSITPEEKQKCDEGFFCCYFSELFSEYHYFCHRDVWNRCVPVLAEDFNYILFCYYSPQKELVAAGYYAGMSIGDAHRDISLGTFLKDTNGEYVYINGNRATSVKFPYDIVLPKLNSMSQAGFIRSVNCTEMRKVMEKALFVIDSVGGPDGEVTDKVKDAIRVLSEAASETNEDDLYSKTKIVKLTSWLDEALDEVEIPECDDLKTTVRKLQDKAAHEENPNYLLQAARLQLDRNDYKYVLSLANYCYYLAHRKRKLKEYDAAKSAYLEAVKLYRHDPVHKRWKEEYVNRCISEYLRIVTYEIFSEIEGDFDFDRYFPVAWEAAQAIAPFVSSDVLGRRIESTYFNYRLERIWDERNDGCYVEFFSENVLNRPIITDIRSNLVARYYQLKAKELEQDYSSEHFLSAAEYRKKAYEAQQTDFRKSSKVSADEDMVECYKDRALAAYLNEDITGFVEDIDRAIKTARSVNEAKPTRRRQENVYDLEGMKYSNLARAPHRDTMKEPAVGGGSDDVQPETVDGISKRSRIEQGVWQINNVLTEQPDIGAFERARDLSITLVDDSLKEKSQNNEGNDAGGAYSVLRFSLEYCVSKSVSSDELWDFVYDVAALKKRLNGDGCLIKMAEMAIAWHLSARFRDDNNDDNSLLLEGIHNLVKNEPIKPVIFYP
ncbi:MAG: hypothetical protein GY771_02840 [bacterium]|nr:hypothetical protein [bacterium]